MIHSTAYLQLFIQSVHAEFVPNIAVSSSLVMVINRQVQTFYFPKLPGNMLNSDRQTNNIMGGLIKKIALSLIPQFWEPSVYKPEYMG